MIFFWGVEGGGGVEVVGLIVAAVYKAQLSQMHHCTRSEAQGLQKLFWKIFPQHPELFLLASRLMRVR